MRYLLLFLLLAFQSIVYGYSTNSQQKTDVQKTLISVKSDLNARNYDTYRYYDSSTGTYISQDPIGLDGGMPNMYSYVADLNSWIDPFGLETIRIFENAAYHGKVDNAVKSKAPINGQLALNNSVQVKPTSPRRVGVDAISNELVVLDRTTIKPNGVEVYHGHVRSWDALHIDQQNALKKANLVDKKGRIKGCG